MSSRVANLRSSWTRARDSVFSLTAGTSADGGGGVEGLSGVDLTSWSLCGPPVPEDVCEDVREEYGGVGGHELAGLQRSIGAASGLGGSLAGVGFECVP